MKTGTRWLYVFKKIETLKPSSRKYFFAKFFKELNKDYYVKYIHVRAHKHINQMNYVTEKYHY